MKILFLAAFLVGCAEPGGLLVVEHDDECDPSAPYADKATCDDDDPATADRCVAFKTASFCAHFRVECDGYDEPAVQAARCDDGDPCTADRCAKYACQHYVDGDC